MAFTQSTEVVETIKVKKKDITSFTPMIKQGVLYIAYDKLDVNGVKVGEDIATAEGVDFQNIISDASTIAGVDIYTPLKQALYNELERQSGESGTIS